MKANGRIHVVIVLAAAGLLSGCGQEPFALDQVWGGRGLRAGQFVRPRAIAIDRSTEPETLYIVDFAGRIQVFDPDGNYLREWRTPTIARGRPSGISVGLDHRVLIADSHYGQVLVYSPEGELLATLRKDAVDAANGFAYVSDVVQDADGFYYVVEFGDDDRISKLAPDGRFVKDWGGRGTEPGRLGRPRGIALGPDGLLYVADSCNHRIQVFDRDGNFIRCWGGEGKARGRMRYPYDVAVAPDGTVYVVEYGNHRVQRFSPQGQSLGCWGQPGRQPGCLNSPWGVAVDRHGRVHVLDTENHRVQRIFFGAVASS